MQQRLFCIQKVDLINMLVRDNQSAVSDPSGLNHCLFLEFILLPSRKQSRYHLSKRAQNTNKPLKMFLVLFVLNSDEQSDAYSIYVLCVS